MYWQIVTSRSFRTLKTLRPSRALSLHISAGTRWLARMISPNSLLACRSTRKEVVRTLVETWPGEPYTTSARLTHLSQSSGQSMNDCNWPYTALPSLSHSAFPYLNGTPIATRRTTTSPTANRNSCGLSGADSFFGIWCCQALCYWPLPQPSPARGRGGASLVGRAPRSGAAWSDVYPPLAPGIWKLEFGPQPRQPEAPETRPE